VLAILTKSLLKEFSFFVGICKILSVNQLIYIIGVVRYFNITFTAIKVIVNLTD
jgi:hypothetical protein